LGTDFCLACGARLVAAEKRGTPVLPGYLDRHVTRSISLINLWFLVWLALTLSGGPIWLSAIICGTLSLYWLIHSWLFRYRTGLVHASRFIGGVGLSVVLTMLALVVLQLWLIRPPVHWRSTDLWVFILSAMLILPLGILGIPAIMQSRLGSQIALEATAYATRWVALERMRYRDTFFLRIPDVRHIPPVSHAQYTLK
jgi:hypothetical protein